MRAARWFGKLDVRVVDLPDPGPPGPGWVRLRVEACGICGTDMEGYLNGPFPTTRDGLGEQRPWNPITLGHESVGVVVEAGPGVDLAEGQRVAVEGHLFCGECHWCRRRDFALCTSLRSLGQSADGGLAEEMLAPARVCLPYADSLLPERAALSEPLSVVVRAVRRAALEPEATVTVVGAGTIGLLLVQVARLSGAARVCVVEPLAARRQLATELGADVVAAPDDADDAIADATDGVGSDVVFEASGKAAVVRRSLDWTRNGGRTVVLGVTSETMPLELLPFLLGEKTIMASLSHTYDVDFPEAVRLLESGKVNVAPLITDRIELDDVVASGFEALHKEPGEHLKIMVFPNGLPAVGESLESDAATR